MVAPKLMGRRWVERMELEPAVWTTASPDASMLELRKRQLGIMVTIGDAVFSIGLDSNGLPAFTVTAVPTTTPVPATPTAPAPAQPTVAAPAPTAAAPGPVDTGTAIAGPLPPPSSLDNTLPATPGSNLPADPSRPLVNTESGNTGLPTAPLQTPRSSTRPGSSSRSSITRTKTGLEEVTQIVFVGGSAVTSVLTLGAEATPQSSGGLSPPAIAGAVVGAVGGTAALLLLLVLCVRWRRHYRDNKRKSAGGESIKALHTGPAPLMAHNSARYTTMFPDGGGVAVSDADSAKMAFLPAGAAGFLNRASGSPLHGPSRTGSPVSPALATNMVPVHGEQNLSVPPSPSVPAHYKSGNSAEVAFLAAGASEWLNRSSNNPMAQIPPPSAGPLPVSSETQGGVVAAAAIPHSASTRSLPGQAAQDSQGGNVAFMPPSASTYLNQQPNSPMQMHATPAQSGDVAFMPTAASAYLNHQPGSPMPSNATPSDRGTVPVAAGTISNDSSRSLPSQNAPENTHMPFLPGDASAFLNRNNTQSPLQSVTTASDQQPYPPPAPSSSAGSSVPYHTPAPESGRVTFLPADASGFLNRSGVSPSDAGIPQIATPPPVPSIYNSGAGLASLAAPVNASERNSAATATNQKLNDNPEWFGSDYHDSRQMPPAAVAAAARQSTGYSGGASELDRYLSGTSAPPPQDSYGPVQQGQNPFDGSRYSTPAHGDDQQIARQDFSQANAQLSVHQPHEKGHTPPPITVPSSSYSNSPWLPPQANKTAPQWPGADDESWYQPGSPDLTPDPVPEVTSWPKPPEIDWNRQRPKPKGAI